MSTTEYTEQRARDVALSCRHIEYSQRPQEEESGSGSKALYALAGLLSIPLWGWCLSAQWSWFVTPIFGLPQITIWQAGGLLLIWGTLGYKMGTRHISTIENYVRCIETLTAPLMLLGVGWLFARLFLGTA